MALCGEAVDCLLNHLLRGRQIIPAFTLDPFAGFQVLVAFEEMLNLGFELFGHVRQGFNVVVALI